MALSIISRISQELGLPQSQVEATTKLLAEGGTVPFIARYRKEATGGLDEVAITSIRDRATQLKALDERKSAIIKSLEERQLLTDDLAKSINAADSLTRLEDIYQPFKPKRRTKAMIAREKGLEPLATIILQDQENTDLLAESAKYVDPDKEVASSDDALAGARDIIAETINDDADLRAQLRKLYEEKATLASRVMRGKEDEAAKFADYFDWNEPAAKAPSHRILAIRRGEAEMMLSMSVRPDEDEALAIIEDRYVKGSTPAAEQVRQACKDSFKRLLSVSMETAARLALKKKADADAIRVFVENLRELLLAPALGEKSVVGIDPGFRTGCKVVCLDAQGKLVFDTVIYPTLSQRQTGEASTVLSGLVDRFNPSAIAIGNGTASRETESFVRKLGLPKNVAVVMVNESGASIYSASEAAREEFPDKDITVRGAVSIGRRLMDPLAELVKIDPKSIGVGQYQHDVDQKALKASLDDTVLSCVNGVGVEINTASKQLLSYVSGLNARLADAIVKHREENGPFKSRKELNKVTGIGPKAFEQAAGFLRIRNADNPLDNSAVHPERYGLVKTIASDLNVNVEGLISDSSLRSRIKLDQYVSEDVGLPTLKDILEELAKPGRDPREKFEVISFKEGVETIEDLRVGMTLPGIVTNVTAFGAFIDVGVHQDGLAHISQLSDHFVRDPKEVVKVGQRVNATVTEIDIQRKRISLSLKSAPEFGSKSVDRRERDAKPQGRSNRDSSRGTKPRRQKKISFGGLGDAFNNLGL